MRPKLCAFRIFMPFSQTCGALKRSCGALRSAYAVQSISRSISLSFGRCALPCAEYRGAQGNATQV